MDTILNLYKLFNDLSTTDKIQLLGILTALFTSVISIIISIASLRQNTKIIKESNKAQIEVFPLRIYGDSVPKIKIQNFGNTTGTITDVKTIPEILPDDMLINPFNYYKGLSLAPNQSFVTVFTKCNCSEPPIEEFDIEIKYKTLGGIQISIFHINYNFLNGLIEAKITAQDELSALNNINQSIQGLQQK